MTREQWLEAAVKILREGTFSRAGHVVPTVRVSVGFPGGGDRRKTIGECWNPNAAEDKVSQVFISPTLRDPVRVLDVLAHELIHAVVPDAGHRAPFKRIAIAIGLTGKMTATVAGPELKIELEKIGENLGTYPHAALTLSGRKKQGTRMIKMQCAECDYVCRSSRTTIERLGPAICPGCLATMGLEITE